MPTFRPVSTENNTVVTDARICIISDGQLSCLTEVVYVRNLKYSKDPGVKIHVIKCFLFSSVVDSKEFEIL